MEVDVAGSFLRDSIHKTTIVHIRQASKPSQINDLSVINPSRYALARAALLLGLLQILCRNGLRVTEFVWLSAGWDGGHFDAAPNDAKPDVSSEKGGWMFGMLSGVTLKAERTLDSNGDQIYI